MEKNKQAADVLILGGGLAGLINAIHLAKGGLQVFVLEKNDFPRHKVCGEYISMEVLPYLISLGIDPYALGATTINRIALSAHNGKTIQAPLPMGGFGISRYTLDHYLFQKAKAYGCQIIKAQISQVKQQCVHTQDGRQFYGRILIGAFGKRSTLDVKLARPFMKKRAPYLAVKNHYRGNFPDDLVALHNFKGGYCGVSKVENGAINVCYLADYEAFQRYKNIELFQQEVLYKNPRLRRVFTEFEPILPKPITISQISFSAKQAVEQHIFMSGDSAGMIHPLCGNGMAMAIHSAKVLSEQLLTFFARKSGSLAEVEKAYAMCWRKNFRRRLLAGQLFQFIFRKDYLFENLVHAMTYAPALLPVMIKQTHGKALNPIQV